jgi:hypothetical protein
MIILRENGLAEIVKKYSAENPEPLTFGAKTLHSLVAESIDEALNGLIGKKPTEAIYDYLERSFSLARDDILQNTQTLFEVMKGLFGEKGSRVIALCIARRVFENLGWEFVQVPGYEFLDYVEMARARIARELVQQAKRTVAAEKELSSNQG